MRNYFEVTKIILVISGKGLGSWKLDQPKAITEIDTHEAEALPKAFYKEGYCSKLSGIATHCSSNDLLQQWLKTSLNSVMQSLSHPIPSLVPCTRAGPKVELGKGGDQTPQT